MAKSIFIRKRDLLYLVYFLLHIPIMFLVDLTAIYPAEWRLEISKTLLTFQAENYQDMFFVRPPQWFVFYTWLELLFHVPFSMWSVWGLWNDSAKVPLVLLVYGLETMITTATCVVDFFSWTDVSWQAKLDLSTLYGPYLAISVFMTVDAYVRLSGMIDNGIGGKFGTAASKKTV